MSEIAVVGSGYVGLTTAACMASFGHSVLGIDIDTDKIERLQRAELPFFEPGLPELVKDGIDEGRLRFSADHADAATSEFVFLCVPTPPLPDGSADRSYLVEAAQALSRHLGDGAVVIVKSTVPVGSAALLEEQIARSDIAVVSNPEFLREGHAVEDCRRPDRLVIGSDDAAVAARVIALYEGLDVPAVVTDPVTAELTKYAANAFLALKLSYMFEIAAVCELVGADVADVAAGLGHDRRIGADYLRPGPGWGGSCLPKDTRALDAISRDAGHDFVLLRSAIEVNEIQVRRVVDKVRTALDGPIDGARISILGLAFKAGTDDVRESPSLRVIECLVGLGADIAVHDPMVSANTVVPDAERFDTALAAAAGADVVVVMTEWEEYRVLDFEALASVMAGGVVVDTRNHLPRDEVRRSGLRHVGTGR